MANRFSDALDTEVQRRLEEWLTTVQPAKQVVSVVSAQFDNGTSNTVREVFDFGDGTPFENIFAIEVINSGGDSGYLVLTNTDPAAIDRDSLPTDGVIVGLPQAGTATAIFPMMQRRTFKKDSSGLFKSFRYVAYVRGSGALTNGIEAVVQILTDNNADDLKKVTVAV